ncbi:late competence development ComFB family protein [Clostridium transplantifaecale]|uniref:late competence development ComFB family protein n=1 Tax=Clostridium transplantifaecale TaxID=2479838 RepID=UPI000F63D724|nr:late competence development ComFB family protein [Clostridium transplantifaecale]
MAKSRAEIDKDMMYRKIMPSTARTGKAITGIDSESSANSDFDYDAGKTSLLSRGAGNNLDTTFSPSYNGESGILPAVRPRKTSGLQLPESQDMILVNVIEELVISRLESTLMRFNCCKCDKCKKDIAAITLNKLAPHYVVIQRGDREKQEQAEELYGSSVTGALVQAIMLVKKSPRH